MARDVSISVPQKDASQTRDPQTRFYELEDWFVEQLLGVLPFLGEQRFWTGTDEEVITARGHANDQIYQLIKGAEVISDIRIEGCIIQKKVGDEWVAVGSLLSGLSLEAFSVSSSEGASVDTTDCVITFNIPRGADGEQGEAGAEGEQGIQGETGADGEQGEQGIQGNQGIQGETGDCDCPPALQQAFALPTADQRDAACYAAYEFARSWCDTLQDLLETIDASSTLIAQSILWTVEWIPWVGSIAENAEELADKVESLVGVNVADIEVVDYVQCKLFCIFVDDPELSDLTLSDFFDPLDHMQIYIQEYILNPTVPLLGDAVLAIMAGWVLAAHGTDWFRTAFGQTSQYAEYFDARDCVGCDDCPPEWEHVFTFVDTLEGWVGDTDFDEGARYTTAPDGLHHGNGRIGSTWYRVLGRMVFEFDDEVHLTHFGITCDFQGDEVHLLRLATGSELHDFEPANGVGVHKEVNGDYDVEYIAFTLYGDAADDEEDLVGGFRTYNVTIRGEGIEPDWD
jgi:hypothetical protein